ncbi:adenine glycosylase [Skermanella stibiiresistens SB22]|uniref:Adenine DNA glycosylase n=1 Tax=Skermanella stibiiresistens SB22 TaxID=1385369 RepID=W9GVW4_9PROT|nr:A/G-specific adenine glycosylase [Skermanella stibiiresistens]EWY36587.1 adenine glycosylase [Skermanella stibiiresistens SB22]
MTSTKEPSLFPAAPARTLEPAVLARSLLAWYDSHRRVLPWRAPAGRTADPYHVWLSEIMLQQTTVVTVGPYFEAFLKRWPTVADLAAADLDAVLHAWAGLGYYARARNLHKCAQAVAGSHGGHFPDTEEGLRQLPGIGAYTAAAVAAIAFDRRATVLDGNVERVMARLFAVEEPLPGSKEKLRVLADTITPDRRPGDYAQAVMDLGATVCVPRKPRCGQCPWHDGCAARAAGIAETLPRKTPKADKPTRRGMAFWLLNPEGAVLLRRRPESGLLGGMIEVPSGDWLERPAQSLAAAGIQAPAAAKWRLLPGLVRHTFTHFHLELQVAAARVGGDSWKAAEGIWVPVDRLSDHALPTVMMKVVRHALGASEPSGGVF